ncbi:ABC transporter substrate-binding protein [Bacteroidota bacterium]
MKKYSFVYLILSFAIIFCATNCNQSNDTKEQVEKITVMLPSVSIGDPHIVIDNADKLSIIFSIYDALVKQDIEGKYQPSLAESWIVEEDKLTWTFNLRKGVKFHNGDVLCAEDVVTTLNRVLNPSLGGAFGTGGVYISYLGSADIKAVDDLEVRIVTKEPMADLLDLLSVMPISPASEIDNLPEKYCGSGPYFISEITNTKIVLKAFEEYWGKAAKSRELHWIASTDEEKRVEALLEGRVDVIPGISLKSRDRIIKDGRAEVKELENSLCIIFMFNSQKGPCTDRRVRQALNYAIDKEEIIKTIKNGAAKALNGYQTRVHFGYNKETPIYPYDPEKARSLLAEAGYKDGLNLVFDIPAVMPNEAPELAQMMVNYYKEVGINVELVVHKDRAAYADMVRAKKINDACCFDSSPSSTYRVLREKINSKYRGPWWQGYENKEVNSLMEKAESTFLDSDRKNIYKELYTLIRDDAPWIFLYNPTKYSGIGSTIKCPDRSKNGIMLFN